MKRHVSLDHPPWVRRSHAAGLLAIVTLATALALLGITSRARPFADLIMPGMASANTVLRNANGVEVTILHVGATIQRLLVPDRRGQVSDVVLGFDDVEPYKVRRPVANFVHGRGMEE